MKITESQLRSIIKQELQKVMLEAEETDPAAELKKRIADFKKAQDEKKAANKRTKPSSSGKKPTSTSPSYEEMFKAARNQPETDAAKELKARIAASKKK